MHFKGKSTLSSKKILGIAASLSTSVVLFGLVFLGLFDFRLSLAEFVLASSLSIYGLFEILFSFLSNGKKKTGGGRIFLSVFFAMVMGYALVASLLFFPKAGSSDKSEEVSVVSPAVESPLNESTDHTEVESVTAEPVYSGESSDAEPAIAETIAEDYVNVATERNTVTADEAASVSSPEPPLINTPVAVVSESVEQGVMETMSEPAPEPPQINEPVTVISEQESDVSSENSPIIRVPEKPIFLGSSTSVSDIAEGSSEPIDAVVPKKPSFLQSVSFSSWMVPSSPVIADPIIKLREGSAVLPLISGMLEAEPEYIEGGWAEVSSSDDDDFWADFYIAGEDELVLEDGVYYFDLYVNGNSAGAAAVLMENGNASIYSEDLRAYVDGYITEEADSRIFRGEEYLTADELADRGIDITVSADEYKIWAVFSPDDMPVERISISGGRYSRSSRNIAGAEVLDPAVFTLLTRYNLSAGFSILPTTAFKTSLNASLSTSNTFRLYDVNGSFMMNLRYYGGKFSFGFSSLSFYYTMPEKMLRLSWGNVSPDLLYVSGTSIGLRLDKSLSYASEGTKRPSHIEKTISVAKDSDVQILNEGKEIYRKTLSAGKYSLNDFILYSGANRIKIIITPLDGSASEEYEIDINYSSSLLAPGEFYYGVAIATGINKVSKNSSRSDSALRMPWFNDYAYEWDARNAAVSAYIRAGLSRTLTMNGTVAVSNALSDVSWFMPRIRGAFEFTHANRFGAARYNLNAGTSRNSKTSFTLPSVYLKASQQFATGYKPISGVSLSGSYSLAEQSELKDWGTASAQIGFSGSVGIIGWNLNGNANVPLKIPSSFSWTASSSISANLSRRVSLSASGSFYSSGSSSKVSFSGRIAASISFSPVRANVAYSTSGLSASLSASDSRNSFSFNMDSRKPESFDSYSFSADYSYTGNYLGFSARTSASSGFRTMNGSLSLSASSIFADGTFAFSQSIPSNFVLIKQKGILRGNELTVGAIGTSTPNRIQKSFGVGLYKGIPSGGNTSFTVFSTNNSSFGTTASFSYSVPSSRRNGYVLTIKADSTYSAAGYVIGPDGETWANGSSPLYSAEISSDGAVSLELSDEYLFTDSDGLFIASGIRSGVWAFDAEIDGKWYLYVFSVEEKPSHAIDIMMLGSSALSDYKAEGPYTAVYVFSDGEYLSGDQFWNMLYSSEED